MSEDEWLLAIIVAELGAKAVLNHMPAKLIANARKRPTITSFGITELAHILSFTYTADTLSIMLVCKQWHAATRRQHFWAKRIERAKKAYLSKGNFKKDPTAVVMAFDTFSSPVVETLRDQTEWVFRKLWIKSCFLSKTGQLTVRRRTNVSTCLCQFSNTDGMMMVRSWMKADGFENNGVHISEKLQNGNVIMRIERPTGISKSGTMCGHTENGHYNGEGREEGSTFLPHGTGKWTFEDGEILEGKGVAFHGEPRMPYKKLKT